MKQNWNSYSGYVEIKNLQARSFHFPRKTIWVWKGKDGRKLKIYSCVHSAAFSAKKYLWYEKKYEWCSFDSCTALITLCAIAAVRRHFVSLEVLSSETFLPMLHQVAKCLLETFIWKCSEVPSLWQREVQHLKVATLQLLSAFSLGNKWNSYDASSGEQGTWGSTSAVTIATTDHSLRIIRPGVIVVQEPCHAIIHVFFHRLLGWVLKARLQHRRFHSS